MARSGGCPSSGRAGRARPCSPSGWRSGSASRTSSSTRSTGAPTGRTSMKRRCAPSSSRRPPATRGSATGTTRMCAVSSSSARTRSSGSTCRSGRASPGCCVGRAAESGTARSCGEGIAKPGGQVFIGREALFWWLITQFRRKRRDYEARFAAPDAAHLRVLRFRKTAEAEAWLASI